jgi:hypothetical protein
MTLISYRVGKKVNLEQFLWKFVFVNYFGEPRVYSSHSCHIVFSPALVGDRLVSPSPSYVVSSVWMLVLLYGFCPIFR